jgi:hypothetical protein
MKKHVAYSLKELKLDDRKTIGYTFKALGAGFYGLRKGTDFRKTITEVIMEAGDADRLGERCERGFHAYNIVCSSAMPLCVEQ